MLQHVSEILNRKESNKADTGNNKIKILYLYAT